jgi:hypothetical protein
MENSDEKKLSTISSCDSASQEAKKLHKQDIIQSAKRLERKMF